MNRDFIIDVDDIIGEYDNIIAFMKNRYSLSNYMLGNRVIAEIIRLHIRGTLDERIFALFRQLHDDWERQVIDLLSNSELNSEQQDEVLNSQYYAILKRQLQGELRQVYNGVDPNFTIWEVEIPSNLTIATISNCGDYRIEQWHHEHGVARVEIKDIMTYDISHLVAFIHRTLNYANAPSRISIANGNKLKPRSRLNYPKKAFYAAIIQDYVAFKIADNKNDEKRMLAHLKVLADMSIISAVDIDTLLNQIDTFYDFEVDSQIDKLSNYRQISTFVISGEEIIINFGSYKSKERTSKSYAELDLEMAEANGDYIPERQRKHRG